MTHILDLPVELLQYITTFLPARSVVSFGQTCKQLLDVTKIESIWQSLCFREYQVESTDGWDLSFKEVYTNVLQEWGFFGWWRLALRPYGGLIYVKWGKGEIQVTEHYPAQGALTEDSLQTQPLYTIRWNIGEGRLDELCHLNRLGPQPAVLIKGGNRESGQNPSISCALKKCLQNHIHSKRNSARNPKFQAMEYDDGSNCPLAPFPVWGDGDQTRSPVQLGLYTGDYSAHGIEILYLHFPSDQPNTLAALKVTGDTNVPAGYNSLEVFLDKPIQLSLEEQESLRDLVWEDAEQMEERCATLRDSLGPGRDGRPPVFRQPFAVPFDCMERAEPPSRTCLSRYLARGRIAYTYYRNPDFCRAHFVQFSDTCFGILWLDLESFSLFHLAKGLPAEFKP